MANTLRSKTWSVSLPCEPQAAFTWMADADNLPRWYGALCRSLSKANGAFVLDTPQGPLGARIIRDDRALVLDLVLTLPNAQLTAAMRVLANDAGSEVVLTLVQTRGLESRAFDEQARWAERAIRDLPRNLPQPSQSPEPVPATETAPTAPEGDSESPMIPASGRKLYVGNLPFQWTEDQLRTQFSEHGVVQATAIARFRGRGGAGRSRGFGFVEMETEVGAQAAIEKLHGGLAGERKIVVRLARSQENKQPTDGATPETATASAPDLTAADETNPPRQTTPSATPPRRSLAPNRNRVGMGRSRRSPAPRAPRPERPSRDGGAITNTGGYEIFPRGSKGGFESQPTARSAAAAPRPTSEASPYFDDTGDIENRGNRPPRRRPRR